MFDKIFGLAWPPIARGIIRKAAEGKYGTGPKAVYEFGQGHKTWVGAVLSLTVACLMAFHQTSVATVLAGAFAGVLLSVGLIDKAWRAVPETWAQLAFFQFMRKYAGYITTGLGTLALRFQACTPDTAAALYRFHIGQHHATCAAAIVAVTLASTFTAWAIGTAGEATPPREA